MEIYWRAVTFEFCSKCKELVSHHVGRTADKCKAIECIKCGRTTLYDHNNIVVKTIDPTGELP